MLEDHASVMVLSPPGLAIATTSTWVLWVLLSKYVFLNLNLIGSGFMFRVTACFIQLPLLGFAAVFWHYKSSQSLCDSFWRLGIFGFLLGIIMGPGNVIAQQAIAESGCTLFMITTLPLIPMSWFLNYCMGVERFKQGQALLLAAAIFTFCYMHQSYIGQSEFYTATRGELLIEYQLFKSMGIYSGAFYSVYLAMALLIFEMTMPFINHRSDIVTQVFLTNVFSCLFDVCGVFKYESWDVSAVVTYEVMPFLVAYAFVDVILTICLFSSLRREFARYRCLLLLRVPLMCIVSQCFWTEEFDCILFTGGSMLFACAMIGEYLLIRENAPMQVMFEPEMPETNFPTYAGPNQAPTSTEPVAHASHATVLN